MKAGPELDILIAEKVMGWFKKRDERGNFLEHWYDDTGRKRARVDIGADSPLLEVVEYAWSPSSNMTDAWDVVEFLSSFKYSRDFLMKRTTVSITPEFVEYFAWFRKDEADQGIEQSEFAESAPLAICLAALKVELQPIQPVGAES